MTALTNVSPGRLFTIPEEKWTAINKRVGEASSASGVTGYIGQYIPEFDLLVTVCKLWQEETFDRLINQSEAISTYAHYAIDRFQWLLDTVNKLNSEEHQLPESIQDQTIGLLRGLSEQTDTLCQTVTSTAEQVRNFLATNRDVDFQLIRYKEKLGIFWEPLEEIVTTMDYAARQESQDWCVLSENLGQFVATVQDITFPVFRGLNIETSLNNWKNLKTECDLFRAISADQKRYWSAGFADIN